MTDSIEALRELFSRPMKSGNCIVQASALHSALCDWDPSTGYQGLAYCIERADGPGIVDYGRIADRMVQKMRKAGIIRHLGKGKWGWVNVARIPCLYCELTVPSRCADPHSAESLCGITLASQTEQSQ